VSIVAGWESDDGSKDWDHRNKVARMLFYITLPPLLRSRIRLLEDAREVFRYLAFYFHDCEPIADPRAKKLATCANEDKRSPSAKSPTSENAAAERHAHAEREDLPTKALTRGTEDVNDGYVGREDPRTKAEASSKGTSAKCTETTPVVLESEPHETQNEPQDSLPLTLRPPIDGEPRECKQEVVESVVTAERTNGKAQSANPPETVVDVDRTASLGIKPAEGACGVDEGDEEREHESQTQQTNLYCKEELQHNEDAKNDVPSAHGLPLEGEWIVCASGETRHSKSCERGIVERACVGEAEAVIQTIVECCQQLCMADGDGDRGFEPADIPNETDTLVIVSIASESPDGGGIPRVHLGGTRSRAGDANGAGNRTDASSCQADASRGQMDALSASNRAETDGMSNGEGAETYLGVRDAKRIVNAMGGVGSHANASSGHADVPNVQTNANKPANATETVSIPPKPKKPPDLPGKGARWAPDEPNGYGTRADTFSVRRDTYRVGNDTETPAIAPEDVRTPRNNSKTRNSPMETARWTPDAPNGCGSHADASSRRTDAYCVGNDTQTAANEAESVRTRRMGSKTQNSPVAHGIVTAKRPRRWKMVSVEEVHVYVPWNASIETASRNFVFGRVESGDEGIAPNVEGERAGDGDGDNGDVGDVDGTTSGGDSDSIRVEAALLAAESQYTRYSSRSQRNDLPMSYWPPIQPARRPSELVRRRRRRGRLKIERINGDQVSKVQQRETTHLGRAHATQPPGNTRNQADGIYRPRRRRGRIKIEPINVSRTRNGGNAHLGRVNAIQSMQRPEKQTRRVSKLTFEFRMLGERWRDDGDYG